jgi:hypothetical protein
LDIFTQVSLRKSIIELFTIIKSINAIRMVNRIISLCNGEVNLIRTQNLQHLPFKALSFVKSNYQFDWYLRIYSFSSIITIPINQVIFPSLFKNHKPSLTRLSYVFVPFLNHSCIYFNIKVTTRSAVLFTNKWSTFPIMRLFASLHSNPLHHYYNFQPPCNLIIHLIIFVCICHDFIFLKIN